MPVSLMMGRFLTQKHKDEDEERRDRKKKTFKEDD